MSAFRPSLTLVPAPPWWTGPEWDSACLAESYPPAPWS